jgi:hypothetical protein
MNLAKEVSRGLRDCMPVLVALEADISSQPVGVASTNPGSDSSKSTLSSTRMVPLTVGPRAVSPLLRVLTTVEWEPARSLPEISSRLIT